MSRGFMHLAMLAGAALAMTMTLGRGKLAWAEPTPVSSYRPVEGLPVPGLVDALTRAPGLIDAEVLAPRLRVRLAYATTDNFVGHDLYGDLSKCYLHRTAAKKLARADQLLRDSHPTLRLLAYDCARPRRVQLRMWDLVKGTPQEAYVANPHTAVGSLHAYGCAIDITLANARGEPLPMGTKYDHFGPTAHPEYEFEHLRSGELSPQTVGNRLLLRRVMVQAGFLPIQNEWWHFNCMDAPQARRKLKAIQ